MATGQHLERWKNWHLQYLCNCLTDINEIWHGDAYGTSATHQPLRFLEFENSRRRPAAILKNQKIVISPQSLGHIE